MLNSKNIIIISIYSYCMIKIIKSGDTLNKILLTIVTFCLICYHKEGYNIDCPETLDEESEEELKGMIN